ncbi:hypothetical protein GEMRC1_006701 [Eukaryota sp. GEM-RC1]
MENSWKDIFSAIILLLAAGDYHKADEYFMANCAGTRLMQSPDFNSIQALLDAYESRDEEKIVEIGQSDQGIGYLMHSIGKVAKKLPIDLDKMEIRPRVVETLSDGDVGQDVQVIQERMSELEMSGEEEEVNAVIEVPEDESDDEIL